MRLICHFALLAAVGCSTATTGRSMEASSAEKAVSGCYERTREPLNSRARGYEALPRLVDTVLLAEDLLLSPADQQPLRHARLFLYSLADTLILRHGRPWQGWTIQGDSLFMLHSGGFAARRTWARFGDSGFVGVDTLYSDVIFVGTADSVWAAWAVSGVRVGCPDHLNVAT